jgi:hypothetical protein
VMPVYASIVSFDDWLTSSTTATLGMSGWLDLTQSGLAPNQKHQAFLGAPKIVHCGLPQDLLEAPMPCAPNYCARIFGRN